jgi:hypothetical protein
MRNKFKNQKAGATLIETLFYILIFTVLSIILINAILYMTRAFKETTIITSLMHSSDVMERMSREIKQADSIATVSSTSIKINTTDSAGNPKTITFSQSGSNIALYENDILVGNLNPDTLVVSALDFTSITTAAGTAIKFSFTVSSTKDSLGRTYDFYNTVALRGAY